MKFNRLKKKNISVLICPFSIQKRFFCNWSIMIRASRSRICACAVATCDLGPRQNELDPPTMKILSERLILREYRTRFEFDWCVTGDACSYNLLAKNSSNRWIMLYPELSRSSRINSHFGNRNKTIPKDYSLILNWETRDNVQKWKRE